MTPRPDLNTLSKEVFEANKAKGFHDVEVSNETLLMLVITELSEAVEADRKGRRADLERFNLLNNNSIERTGNTEYFNNVAFADKVKDTLEDELADAVIRLLDLAGLRGWRLSVGEANRNNVPSGSFPQLIFYTTKIIIDFIHVRFECKGKHISFAIECIEAVSQHLSIDLWKHVSLKLKYNQTRPIKHGKNY